MTEEKKIDSIFSATNGSERRALAKIDIVSIRILERWDECLNLFQLYYESKLNNSSNTEILKNKLESVLYAIFLMNKELFRRKVKDKSFIYLENIEFKKRDHQEIKIAHEEYFTIVNKVFDELGLVRVDFERIQKTLEQTNQMRGLD